MNKPNRNQIYDAVIRRMVTESLVQKEKAFYLAHHDDSDDMLLDYLQSKAKELGHTPWPKEIVGWKLISERFGGWSQAVCKANLPQMRTKNAPTSFQLYKEELDKQKKNYKRIRDEKKARSALRDKERKQKKYLDRTPQSDSEQ